MDHKRTILCVDDHESMRKAYAAAFNQDYRVLLAENGREALAILEKESHHVNCVLLDLQMPIMDGWQTLRTIYENKTLKWIPVIVLSSDTSDRTEAQIIHAGAWGFIGKAQSEEVIRAYIENAIIYHNNYLSLEEHCLTDVDPLTGIWNKEHFYRQVRHRLEIEPPADYCLIRFDLDRFKVFNDIFGIDTGNELLGYIGKTLIALHPRNALYAHIEADHFALLIRKDGAALSEYHQKLMTAISAFPARFDYTIKMGVYTIDDLPADPVIMCDRAFLALRTTKESATVNIGWYGSELRERMLKEQEMLSDIKLALDRREFVVYYQPQYNYATGEMIGAEALVRWNHPKRGIITPGDFIPLMERNGLISQLDEFVWEQCCVRLRQWRENAGSLGQIALSVSANVSRIDIYRKDLCEFICELADKYGIPHHALKLEITESAYMDNPEQIIEVVRKMRKAGFIIEMDDFGSGYSSLNTLKDVPVDILKLDMKFLVESHNSQRGGSILSSIIRMARWLKLPIIAEGVETREQADYLKTIGCLYMQGYFFARPMTAPEFEKLAAAAALGVTNKYECVDTSKADPFWDASTQSALIFNSFVGGAAILEFDGQDAEILRLNDRFLEIIRAAREQYIPFMRHTQEQVLAEYRPLFLNMLKKASETGTESAAILCSSSIADGSLVWMQTRARLLSHNIGSDLFYLSIEDMTEQRKAQDELLKQQTFLQALYSSIPCGVLLLDVVDGGLRLRNCNDQAWRLLGYDSMETLRETFASGSLPHTIYEADKEQVLQSDQMLLCGHCRRAEISCRVEQPNKSYRWIHSISERNRFRDGTDVVERVLLDITAQQDAQLITYGSALISAYDEVALFDYANQVSTLLYSKYYQGDNINVPMPYLRTGIERWIENSVHPDDRGLVRLHYDPSHIRECIRGNTVPTIEFRAVSNTGEVSWIRGVITQLECERYLVCHRDITELRRNAPRKEDDA